MALSKLAVRRLTKLADFMEALPRDKKHGFDMGTYIDDGACGTVCCALGWADKARLFPRLKLDRCHSLGGAAALITDGGDYYAELFRDGLSRSIHTPQQWAKHCRRFLKEHA